MSGYPIGSWGNPGTKIETKMEAIKALAIVQDRVAMIAAMARVLGDESTTSDEGQAALGIAVIADLAYERMYELNDALRELTGLPSDGYEDPEADRLRAQRIETANERSRAEVAAYHASLVAGAKAPKRKAVRS